MNPILPVQYFVPDVEARQFQDGRMYLYGSSDISGNTVYCSQEYRVFSSADLVHWTDHGVSFRSQDVHSDPTSQLYAPDCVCIKGRYYLCYCCSDKSEGIAVSDSPSGPFKNAFAVQGADGDAIDPAILLDDDGQVYYYWGQFHLRGARLTDDLSAIDPTTLETHLVTEAEHGFHEGASIRKRHGVYYLVYTDISRGRATCLAYAASHSPLGPFEKRGIIVDNTGCDPGTWNNHGSIAEFNGEWYVFYHRSSQASKFNRRVCVEPIHFRQDGSIDPVEMTTQGISGPLPATQRTDAYRACLLSGTVRTESIGPGDHSDQWREHLTWIHDGDWAACKYLDFGEGVSSFHARAGSLAYGGRIEVRIDQPDGPLLCVCDVSHSGGWHKWRAACADVKTPVSGTHALYLVFRGGRGRLFDLDSFWFAR
jgi:hypothetical protein